jgi:hypothetical protein
MLLKNKGLPQNDGAVALAMKIPLSGALARKGLRSAGNVAYLQGSRRQPSPARARIFVGASAAMFETARPRPARIAAARLLSGLLLRRP